MKRKLARPVLTIIMIGSLMISAFNFHAIWRNPTVFLLADRALDQVKVRIEQALSTQVTTESIEKRLVDLLGAQPHNWLVIEAVESIAAEQGIRVSSELQGIRDKAYDAEHGFWVATGKCTACALNAQACELSAVLLCRAPIDLTPVGDIVGIIRESKHYAFGQEVDMFDLGLSVFGIGATVLIPLTGGTSTTLKVGASMLKTARIMRRISEPLMALMRKTFREAIDWDIISNSSFGNYRADIGRAINPNAIQPAVIIVDKMGSIRSSVGIPATLHLMKSIDTPQDARAISRLAEASGDRTVGLFEVLGKNKVVRSTLRYSDEAIGFVVGIIGLISSLMWMVVSFLGSMVIRKLRVFTKPK